MPRGVFVSMVVLPVGFLFPRPTIQRDMMQRWQLKTTIDDIMQHLYHNKKDDSINYSPRVRKMFDNFSGLEFGYVFFFKKEGLF